MIVSEIQLYNFRKFKAADNVPGLSLSFHKGLNALIGENDSGKSAVIDAIKLVLLTQSNEYLHVVDDDFYSEDGIQVKEFRIDLTLSDFTLNEAKNFVEILEFTRNGDKPEYFVHLHYRAWKEGTRIFTELHAGEIGDNVVLDGKARELLKCVYLRPLRDAEREMSSGRNSRISQILYNHPVFRTEGNEEHKLIEILKKANADIEKYFTEEDGKVVLSTIRETLTSFNEHDTPSGARLETSSIQLKAILESLSLSAEEIHPGLGELNLLFIAAELLLLQHDDNGGLRLALIEELEAHLHPQAQLRLIQYLQKEYNGFGVQIIISTHSPVLASKINLKNLILLKNGHGYDFAPEKTRLEKGDYLFLQRFLDATKANLFFAKGVIMVEGDAENLLIPVIADIIGLPLERYGVSIVNVGSTAFLRYSRIFVRADKETIGIPISIITDCDVKPWNKEKNIFDEKNAETNEKIKEKETYYTIGSVKGFIASRWTFEYCLALSSLRDEFHKAVQYGIKVKNSDQYALTKKKIEEVDEEIVAQEEKWRSFSEPEYAYHFYSLMLNDEGKSGLKAIVAQCLASLLRWEVSCIPDGVTKEQMFDLDIYQLKVDEKKKAELKARIEADQYLKYIVNAIKYATRHD